MKKADLDKLRGLHNYYMMQSRDAIKQHDKHQMEVYQAKAIAVCEVLEVLEGISYTAAVNAIIEEVQP